MGLEILITRVKIVEKKVTSKNRDVGYRISIIKSFVFKNEICGTMIVIWRVVNVGWVGRRLNFYWEKNKSGENGQTEKQANFWSKKPDGFYSELERTMMSVLSRIIFNLKKNVFIRIFYFYFHDSPSAGRVERRTAKVARALSAARRGREP